MPVSLLKNALRVLATGWAAASFVFIVLRLSGDPIAAFVPSDMPQELMDAYRTKYGLDAPIWEQYLNYLFSILRGDFGYSFRTNEPAAWLVLERLPATLILTGSALTIAIIVGVASGVGAALYRNTYIDRLLMSISVFGFAMPNFFFGVLLILVFSMSLGILPSSGFNHVSALILPTLTLALAASGAWARLTRSTLLEVLSQPYMETALAKGLSPFRIIVVHGMRGILVPLASLLGFSVGAMVTGAIVTETVFGWPGVGRLLVVSVSQRDLAVVQLIVIMSALVMAISNSVIDLALGVLDPRIGTTRRNR